MNQGALTIEAPIAQVAPLRALLQAVQGDVDTGKYQPLCGMRGLHFASFVIWDDAEEPVLLFEANFDGPADAFLREWTERFEVELDAIFRHCQGYPEAVRGLPGVLLHFLEDRNLGPGYWYQGHAGRSAGQIQREETLRQTAGRIVDEARAAGELESEPVPVLHRIVAGVHADGQGGLQHDPGLPFRVRHGRKVLAGGALLALAALVALAICWTKPFLLAAAAVALLFGTWLRAIRLHELRDEPATEAYQSVQMRQLLATREDHRDRVQNHMVSFVRVKPGRLRGATLRAVLAAIAFLGRWHFNRGQLGKVATIHFARWVILRRRERDWLVFLSNYDGSWDGYLDDFVDLAAAGLTGIWSNTEGFPRTCFLVRAGARDGPRFKAWARSTMSNHEVWYSAYPELSVLHVQGNNELRRNLFRSDLSEAERDAVLRRV